MRRSLSLGRHAGSGRPVDRLPDKRERVLNMSDSFGKRHRMSQGLHGGRSKNDIRSLGLRKASIGIISSVCILLGLGKN